MGSRLSGILATLVMDDLERSTLTADLSICLYCRYVDDIFIMTTSSQQADTIFAKFNSAHTALKFESEKPEEGTNKLSLLDFTVTINSGNAEFTFFRKKAKKNVFVHNRSAIPKKQKSNIIIN